MSEGQECADVLCDTNINNCRIIWNNYNILEYTIVVQQCGTVKLYWVAKFSVLAITSECVNTQYPIKYNGPIQQTVNPHT